MIKNGIEYKIVCTTYGNNKVKHKPYYYDKNELKWVLVGKGWISIPAHIENPEDFNSSVEDIKTHMYLTEKRAIKKVEEIHDFEI